MARECERSRAFKIAVGVVFAPGSKLPARAAVGVAADASGQTPQTRATQARRGSKYSLLQRLYTYNVMELGRAAKTPAA